VKRFRWPLQRLLDVTVQRETTQRAALLDVSRQIAVRRQEVLVHRSSVRGMILEISAVDLEERLRRHEDFVRFSRAHERAIERLTAELDEWTRLRAERTRELLETRRRREALERLRAEAEARHLREQRVIEQKEFDETAHVSKARKLIESHRAGRETVAASFGSDERCSTRNSS